MVNNRLAGFPAQIVDSVTQICWLAVFRFPVQFFNVVDRGVMYHVCISFASGLEVIICQFC